MGEELMQFLQPDLPHKPLGAPLRHNQADFAPSSHPRAELGPCAGPQFSKHHATRAEQRLRELSSICARMLRFHESIYCQSTA